MLNEKDSTKIEIEAQDLPDGWNMTNLGNLIKIRNGFAFKSQDYKEEGILLIRQSNLSGSKVSLEKAKYLPTHYLKNYADFTVLKGDILIGMSGSIGKLCVYDREEPALQNQRTGLLVFKDQKLKPWVWHYLPLLDKQFQSAGKGVAVLNVSAGQIESFSIPIAPMDQQKCIVAEIEKQFSRLDEAVANLKRVKANLKRYKAAVLKAAVEGKLTEDWRKAHPDVEPASKLLGRILTNRRAKWKGKGKYKEPTNPDTSNLPALPKGWIWTNLGQIFQVYIGATPSRGKPEYWNGNIAWVSSGEVAFCRIRNTRERITEKGLANTSTEIHPPGTVLLGMIGEGKTRGQAAILDTAACNNQNSAAIRVAEAGIPPEYVYRYLEGQYAQNRSIGSGNNQPALNKVRVQAIPLPLSPLAEQEQIVEEVERRLSVIEELEATVESNLTRAARFQQSILSQAFDGRLLN